MKSIIFIMILFSAITISAQPLVKKVILDPAHTLQTIDGFGVNINPAMWDDGHLRPVLDLLVDDLGCTQIRFDAYGTADWLDPDQRVNGVWPQAYLAKVYSSPVFQDAWETFRYLNDKGLQPHFNVSGRIAPQLAGADGKRLVDYNGYAEMVVSMLKWAREKEALQFSLFAPFNETDLGFPEGPLLLPEDVLPAVSAIVEKLDNNGLQDVKLILLCDAAPRLDKIEPILSTAAFVGRIAAFSTHTYGNGGDEDGSSWFMEKTPYANFVEAMKSSQYKSTARAWMSEYGDLDQTGEVEFGIAWRSTRRLLNALADGFSVGMVWDAFDNLHKHDNACTTYGLLAYDRETRLYTPKIRYYAAQQLYKFIRPGMIQVKAGVEYDHHQTYALFKSPLKHMRILVFVSPELRDLTVVGMSTIESDVRLQIDLSGLACGDGKTVSCYRTSRHEQFKKCDDAVIKDMLLEAIVPENSIFTLTTYK
jgi:hypothetical protein